MATFSLIGSVHLLLLASEIDRHLVRRCNFLRPVIILISIILISAFISLFVLCPFLSGELSTRFPLPPHRKAKVNDAEYIFFL